MRASPRWSTEFREHRHFYNKYILYCIKVSMSEQHKTQNLQNLPLYESFRNILLTNAFDFPTHRAVLVPVAVRACRFPRWPENIFTAVAGTCWPISQSLRRPEKTWKVETTNLTMIDRPGSEAEQSDGEWTGCSVDNHSDMWSRTWSRCEEEGRYGVAWRRIRSRTWMQ
jgi:hypothetical protein